MPHEIVHSKEDIKHKDRQYLQIPVEGIIKQIKTSLHAYTHRKINQDQTMERNLIGTIRRC